MTGVKGKSGGRREGAGNRAGTSTGPRPMAGPKVKIFQLRIGELYRVGLDTWTVTAVSKDSITFTDCDGRPITLVR